MKLHDWLYLLTGIIIPSYKILDWLGGIFGSLLKKIFIRTEKQAILWVHAKEHAMRKGHKPKGIIECKDGRCLEVR